MVRAFRAVFALVATLAGAACGQVNNAASVPAASALYASVPPRCQGQRTARRYAQLKVKLTKQGGSFCVPESAVSAERCDTPGSSARSGSSSQQHRKYLQRAATRYGESGLLPRRRFPRGNAFWHPATVGSGLTSKKIVAGQPYTAFGVVTVGHLALEFPPCYAIATQGTYGKVLSSLGALFAGTIVTGPGYGAEEIYPGRQDAKVLAS